jgi:hypothetical protein
MTRDYSSYLIDRLNSALRGAVHSKPARFIFEGLKLGFRSDTLIMSCPQFVFPLGFSNPVPISVPCRILQYSTQFQFPTGYFNLDY